MAYMSASFEGVHLSSPNLDGTRCSGGMKGVLPPNSWAFAASIHNSGSSTIDMNPKSVRHAVMGLVFAIRMLA